MEKEQKESLMKIILAIVVFLTTFIPGIFDTPKMLLYIIAYLIVGGEVIIKAIQNVGKKEFFDENLLMTIATIGALAIKEFPEAVAVMLFYQIGELLQDIAVDKSKKSITKLMNIRPDYANLEKDGKIIKVNPEDVKKGEIIIVKPGEKIPLDGVVVEGTASLNTTAITGESLPKKVDIGDTVISGTVNLTGVLKIKTTTEFAESTVSKILELVEHSEKTKANSEKFITKFSKIYTPVVVFLAVAIAIILPLVTGGNWAEWLNRALIFLVISCPCALVVSVPLSFFAGIGGASKNGVLVKGANYLEALAKTETVVFDKTGTLTKGNFQVTAIHPEEMTKDNLLEIAVLTESYSEHPISMSLKHAYEKKIDKSRVKNIEEITGKGIKATVDGREVYIGNDKLMETIGADYKACKKEGTITHIAIDGKYMGHIVIADEIKETSKQAITELKALGIKKTVMLTGDKKEVGEAVGKELGIDVVKTELLPTDKVENIKNLLKERDEKSSLVFVGDGINDAPVLKIADIGIAMGGLGSDAAIEAADMVLMDDNPEKIAKAIKISRKTLKIVKENIGFALTIKVLVLLLGVLGVANMWEAVFADVGVSIIAIINALRCVK